MYEKIKEYVRAYDMLEQSDSVIAGVSGGADSVCLLSVLLKLREIYALKITAVHVNHQMRGTQADADEDFVRELCERLGVPLKVCRVDVPALAKERGLSSEEAGREARREAFALAAAEHKGTKIALAHHIDDNVETLFLNIARGTGLRGLGGMQPVKGLYIRPLLCVKRREIEEYLGENGIEYCIDQTNFQDTYTRNRIRNHVIPYMEQHVNEKTTDHAVETMRQMQELGAYIEGQVSACYETCVSKEEGGALIRQELYEAVPLALRPYLIRKVLVSVSGKEKDIEAIHLRDAESLWKKQPGKRINLPYHMLAKRCYEGIRITVQKEKAVDDLQTACPKVWYRVWERGSKTEAFEQTPYTKWFDYDIIKDSVIVRTRRPGDYITIDKEGNTQKLKKYFINEKIPEEMRSQILLAADGSHIMWIVGYRLNQKYQVTGHTKRILEIRIDGGKKDGRDN